jgi:hypothetical protein
MSALCHKRTHALQQFDAGDRVVLAARNSAGALLRIVAIIKGGDGVRDVVSRIGHLQAISTTNRVDIPAALIPISVEMHPTRTSVVVTRPIVMPTRPDQNNDQCHERHVN